ncbi:MAG: hypothetical protein ICV81_07115, partial [Flavisolibacter sp.]|nr:hypothetical protein [Flavisolibacter sp.]
MAINNFDYNVKASCHELIPHYRKFNKRKIALLFFICSNISLTALTQTTFPDSLQTKFNNYQQQFFPQKVFVHTDKNFYVAGEIIWFTAYLVDGFQH